MLQKSVCVYAPTCASELHGFAKRSEEKIIIIWRFSFDLLNKTKQTHCATWRFYSPFAKTFKKIISLDEVFQKPSLSFCEHVVGVKIQFLHLLLLLSFPFEDKHLKAVQQAVTRESANSSSSRDAKLFPLQLPVLLGPISSNHQSFTCR